MGILVRPLEMVAGLGLKPKFAVCELGDQWITHGERRLASVDYVKMGCSRYEAIDGNGRGTMTADLNLRLPIHEGWASAFDLVTDFGTGEHVFNQYQVFKTIHDLCKAGGFMVFDRPAQGYEEHCFWLVNECVYRDLAAANGYEVMALENEATTRGKLLRGVMRKATDRKFIIPQQRRYHKLLRPIAPELSMKPKKE